MSELERTKHYDRLRGNMLCNKVEPSGDPSQPAKTTLFVIGHGTRDLPMQVTYNLGPKFNACTKSPEPGDRYETSYRHYGPMLAQAILKFADGTEEIDHIYCPMPEQT